MQIKEPKVKETVKKTEDINYSNSEDGDENDEEGDEDDDDDDDQYELKKVQKFWLFKILFSQKIPFR